MPGRLFLETPISALAAALGAVADPADEDGPRLNMAPGQDVRVLNGERRLVRMRWGLIPMGRKNARGRPVMETIVNARSETVFDKSAFAGVARGVV
ncbi:MAG: SOS response-associated peptidase family protein, partial [Pseudomonadota bacterium]